MSGKSHRGTELWTSANGDKRRVFRLGNSEIQHDFLQILHTFNNRSALKHVCVALCLHSCKVRDPSNETDIPSHRAYFNSAGWEHPNKASTNYSLQSPAAISNFSGPITCLVLWRVKDKQKDIPCLFYKDSQ